MKFQIDNPFEGKVVHELAAFRRSSQDARRENG